MLEVTTPGEPVHRVGYAPDPWTWVPWEYVDRATGRWDDPEGNYRVLYAGTSPEACFVEVLSPFRPDPSLDADMSAINGDPRDARYPSVPAGTVDASWLDRRRLGRARLTGTYVDVTHKNTIAELRASLLHRAAPTGCLIWMRPPSEPTSPGRSHARSPVTCTRSTTKGSDSTASPTNPGSAPASPCGPSSSEPTTPVSTRAG